MRYLLILALFFGFVIPSTSVPRCPSRFDIACILLADRD